MLNKTFEFLRIADPQPTDEKVRKRTESATAVVAQLAQRDNQSVLLASMQGIVGGFDGAPFTRETPAVVLLIKAIKDTGAALPEDLTENAMELRAVAGIAVGELLTRQSKGPIPGEAVLTALSIRSALALRPPARDKHLRWMLDTLFTASDQLLQLTAERRRQRATTALLQLGKVKESADVADLWKVFAPAVKSALKEASAQAAIDREEIETLWWMFEAYSDIEQKPLAELSPWQAAFCSGIELAQRALLPPSPSAEAMVRRAVESGRKQPELEGISLQKAIADWSEPTRRSLSPMDGSMDEAVSRHPALLPISWACRRLREAAQDSKLGKEFTAATGILLSQLHTPTEWGQQVFREKVLHRLLTRSEETQA